MINIEVRKKILIIFLFITSRPIFFNFFYYVIKVCMYAMNRTAAADFIDLNLTGEKLALNWIFRKLPPKNKYIIFDCGGNTGSYTELILELKDKLAGEIDIHIFEPSQTCYEILERKFGSLENIYSHKYAVSDRNSQTELYYPWVGSTGASLSRDVSQAQRMGCFQLQSEQVVSVTLDNFCDRHKIEHLDYVKLDIEGYELSALHGMREMFLNRRVSYVQLEIGAASLATKSMLYDVWNLLCDNYTFYLVLNRGVVKINEYKPDLECFHGASNFILELK
jgi:FkbM family methyltransferase